MADGSDLELQAAINAALVGDANVQALLGDPPRLYQDVPQGAVVPYATFGLVTTTTDADQCQDASDVFLDIEIWSRTPGFEDGKRIASAIRRVLHDRELTLATQRCVLIEHAVTRHIRDDEAPMKQSIVTFHAKTEER